MEQTKIGEVFIRYNEQGLGTLALDLNLDINPSEKEVEALQEHLTAMNEIIISQINKRMKEEDKE